MKRFFRILLLWLIAIALPVQATAAVFKASCGASHQDGAPVSAQAYHSDHATAHDVHASMQHANSDADGAYDTQCAAGDSACSHASSDNGSHKHSTCSACAACCVAAAAPPSGMAKTPEFTSYEKAFPFSSSLADSFIPAGLERPPRFLFV